jgi:hypothetical protein
MSHPCPAWCQLWPGHGLPDDDDLGRAHERLVGKYLTTAGKAVVVELSSYETEDGGRVKMSAPYASISDGVGLEEMSSRDLRALAELFLEAADQLDKLATFRPRPHLAAVPALT